MIKLKCKAVCFSRNPFKRLTALFPITPTLKLPCVFYNVYFTSVVYIEEAAYRIFCGQAASFMSAFIFTCSEFRLSDFLFFYSFVQNDVGLS